ncbi:MAG: leucine-rich repeat domain-containing protein, partial [Muribaculaceae bacterium]|nr:leucine-rich repeat domain-containing protein [Muribaculaceae bacterium]
MKGEKAREIGSPDYRHPLRNDSDFNEHIDDFSIAVISLSLKAIALNPDLKSKAVTGDTLLLSEREIRSPQDSKTIKGIQSLTNDSDLSTLLGIFYIAYAKNSLEAISFRLFMTDKPKVTEKQKRKIERVIEKIDTSWSDKDIEEGVADEFGVIYSKDGKRLLKCRNRDLAVYKVKTGTKVICDRAFDWCTSLQSVTIPESVTAIGAYVFFECSSLQSVIIPDSVTSIGAYAFDWCTSLQSVTIPESVTAIGAYVFFECSSLQ